MKLAKLHAKYKIISRKSKSEKLMRLMDPIHDRAKVTGMRSIGGVHVSQQSSTSMFERCTLLGIGHRHRYSQKDPYRNRPLGLLTSARQTLTERNRLRGIPGVAISIYPREDVFIWENGRPTFRLRCRSKVSLSASIITSSSQQQPSLSLSLSLSRCTLSKYNIDCKKIF